MSVSAANDEQARYWNGDEALHWVAHEARYERMLAPYTGHLLAAVDVHPRNRVLDVGCGCGATSRAAARLATDGDVLGVDISRPLLEQAERRTQEEGLTNVRFQLGDVQIHRFVNKDFDVAVSRFGTMFFGDPTVGFASIGRALSPVGRLAFVCWAEPVENEWFAVPGAAAAKYIALPSVGDPSSPGPFSLSDRERLAAILDAAGMDEVNIRPVTEPLLLGSDVEDTVVFLRSTGFGQRVLAEADVETVDRVTDAWRAALNPYATSEGIRLDSKVWLVTARHSRRSKGNLT